MKKSILFIFLFLNFSLHAEFFTINDYKVQIQVNDDGSFDVNESIDLTFSQERRGIIRSIPYIYELDSKKAKIKIENVYVEDWNFKTYKEGGYHNIRVGDADVFINGPQKYQLSYRVQNAYVWTDDLPEFYWNIIGHDWDVPIENIEFEVTFPEELTITNRDYRIFSGKSGSAENAILLTKNNNWFKGKSTRPFEIGEGISLAVRLNENFIEKPIWYRDLWKSNSYAPYGLGGIILLLFFWKKNGRNEKLRKNVPLKYFPPEGFSAPESGFFIDNKADHTDLLSLLPEWGEKGFIHISRSINPELDEADAFIFEKLKNLPSDTPVYQQTLFNAIFEEGDITVMADLKNKIYTSLHKSRSQLRKHVRKMDVYDPTALKLFHSGWMILVFCISLISGILVMGLFKQFILGIFLILLAIMALVIHFLRPRYSEKGIELKDHLVGFKKFLKAPDEHKVSELIKQDETYFERMFPFAMAFGLEKGWTDITKKYITTAPIWYHDTDTHGNRIPTNMNQFSNQFKPKSIQSAFKSQPAPSSSSGSGGGFSGGGSSGGGFGGGGGSSW